MEPLLPDAYYHIYNRANGDELVFKEKENYRFFLEKYVKFIHPIADTMVYCFMPNHFHLIINVHDFDRLEIALGNQTSFAKGYMSLTDYQEKEKALSKYVSKQFSNLFSSYAQAFNRMYGRMGSLFMRNFKRKRIGDEKYFIDCVRYIHNNPVNHGFVEKPEQWEYSSYNIYLLKGKTFIKKGAVLERFGGLRNFKFYHLASDKGDFKL